MSSKQEKNCLKNAKRCWLRNQHLPFSVALFREKYLKKTDDEIPATNNNLEKLFLDFKLQARPKKPSRIKALICKQRSLEVRLEQALEDNSTLSNKARELEEMVMCSICFSRRKSSVFPCGHAFCYECASRVSACSFCRSTNTQTQVLFL